MKVKVLGSDRLANKPRSGPTKETDVKIESVAFATIMEWQSTGRDYQQFVHITDDTTVSAPAVRVLFLYLTKTDDSANIAYDYNPVNVLPITENIDDVLSQLNKALGIAFYKCQIKHESLTPAGYPTKGLMIDRRRYKPSDTVGDCWINLLSVTQAIGDMADDQGSQQVVISNWHPQPVPKLEYRITFQYDPNFLSIYNRATSSTKVDFKSSFPPDDGSGDWLYAALSKVCDLGRHGSIEFHGNGKNSRSSPFIQIGVQPPQMMFWMARFNPNPGIMMQLNYNIPSHKEILKITGVNFNVGRGDSYSGTDVFHWGTADIDTMQSVSNAALYNPKQSFGEVKKPWTLATILPLLPLIAVPRLFDQSWSAERIASFKNNSYLMQWYDGLYTTGNKPDWMQLKSLADAGTLPAGKSDLLTTLFNVLANRPNGNTFIAVTGVSPSHTTPGQAEPDVTAYNNMRVVIFTFPDDQTIYDVLPMNPDASGMVKYPDISGYVQRRIAEPCTIDFTYTPYPTSEKFIDVLKRELTKAGFTF